MMPESTLRDLQRQERQLKQTLESIKRFGMSYSHERDEHQVEVRMSMLEDTLSTFYVVRRRIEVLMNDSDEEHGETSAKPKPEDDRLNENTQLLWNFEDAYCEVKALLMKIRKQNTDTVCVSSAPMNSRVKLPDIILPTFSGKLMQWVTFRDTFRSLIHENSSLSAIDKFTYLRTSLTGEALLEIGSIDLTAANYEVAWTTLERRYENKKMLLKAHLDAIFSVEPARRECFEVLNHLLSTLEKNLQMIDKIGVKTSDWSIIMAYILSSKLDLNTFRVWETHHKSNEHAKYEDMIEFLRGHCAVLQSIAPHNSNHNERQPSRVSLSHSISAENDSCCFCSGPKHSVFHCPDIRQMNCNDRIETARKNRLCFNCLGSTHKMSKCTRGFCTICQRKHHTLLHDHFVASIEPPYTMSQSQHQSQQSQNRPQNQDRRTFIQSTLEPTTAFRHRHGIGAQQIPSPTTDNIAACNQSTITAEHSHEVLLPTAIVRVCDQYGQTLLARAILDSASQRNLMAAEFARRLKGKQDSNYMRVRGVGSSETVSRIAVEVTVSSQYPGISSFSELMTFNVLNKVSTNLPSKHVGIQNLSLPHRIPLADPRFNIPASVDIIIGAEHYNDLLLDGRMKSAMNNGLTLQNTVFGWIMSGAVKQNPMRISHLAKTWIEENEFVNDTAEVPKKASQTNGRISVNKPERMTPKVAITDGFHFSGSQDSSKFTSSESSHSRKRDSTQYKTWSFLLIMFFISTFVLCHTLEIRSETSEQRLQELVTCFNNDSIHMIFIKSSQESLTRKNNDFAKGIRTRNIRRNVLCLGRIIHEADGQRIASIFTKKRIPIIEDTHSSEALMSSRQALRAHAEVNRPPRTR